MENPFIKDLCEQFGIAKADIEVPLREQYGQVAEDVIVDGLLTAWAQRSGTNLSDCRYLEIGANHPFATSASILLHRLHGMTGVLVEANESLIDVLRSARAYDEVVYCAVTSEDVREIDFFVSNLSELSSLSREFVEEWPDGALRLAEVRRVPAQRVNALLEAHFAAAAPVFLSVDVEGMDLDILQDVDWTRWRPVVVQAEPSEHFSPGQSQKIISFMHEKGYVLVARTAVNLIFTDRAALFGGRLTASPEDSESDIPVPTAPFIAPRPNYSETVSVGIVTRTKNRAVLLRRALESVKNQTYPHWQLVIVNDGGEPSPVNELIKAIFGEDNRVSVVHHPASVGMEAASNSGLSRLNTELAVIHDDDDSWAPDMLAVATAVLRNKNAEMPSIRGIVTRVNLVQETVTANHVKIDRIEPWNEHGPDRLEEGLIKLSRLAMQNVFPPIAFVFDLSLARQLGGFDQNLPVLGDWDFNLRFCMESDIWVHPELLAFYHHRQNAIGDMGNTVIAGKSKHELYNTYLRNKLLRTASDPVTTAMALMREQGLLLSEIRSKLDQSYEPLRVSGGGDSNDALRKQIYGVRTGKCTGVELSDLNHKIIAARGNLHWQERNFTNIWGATQGCVKMLEFGDFVGVWDITSKLLLQNPSNLSLLEAFIVSDVQSNFGGNACILLDNIIGLSSASEALAKAYFDVLSVQGRYSEAFFHIADVLEHRRFKGFENYCDGALESLRKWDERLMHTINDMTCGRDTLPLLDAILVAYGSEKMA